MVEAMVQMRKKVGTLAAVREQGTFYCELILAGELVLLNRSALSIRRVFCKFPARHVLSISDTKL